MLYSEQNLERGITMFSLNKICCLFFLQILLIGAVYSQIEVLENGPVNEAFITPIGGDNLIFNAISAKPPEPIDERIPLQTDSQAEWIPGYWAWQNELHDFIWVSGTWRRPPQDHLWISGFWKEYPDGWVWIHGFWNRVPENKINYIGIAPPDVLDENSPPPPNDNYAWNSGYWYFLPDSNDYQWVPGDWEEMNPDWILMPAHYVWRPGGYVFIPSYWDWPLDKRGKVFAPVQIQQEYRYRADFEPEQSVDASAIIQNYLPFYPNYLPIFHHHYRYHQNFWNSCSCTPTWWGWTPWWSFNWRDQWGLWWWYTHPGYPQPAWMSSQISSIIAPPGTGLLALMAHVNPPVIVTPKGVISRKQLLEATSKVTGRFSPIVPFKQQERDKIFGIAKPLKEDKAILKPTGKQLPFNPKMRRPSIRKPVIGPGSNQVRKLPEEVRPRVPYKPKLSSGSKQTPSQNVIHQERIRESEPKYPNPIWTPPGSKASENVRGVDNNRGFEKRESISPIWKPKNSEPVSRPSVNKVQNRENQQRKEQPRGREETRSQPQPQPQPQPQQRKEAPRSVENHGGGKEGPRSQDKHN